MKVYDCITYSNERLLFNLRLNILDKFVDKFIVIEGDNSSLRNQQTETKGAITNNKVLITSRISPKGLKLHLIDSTLTIKEQHKIKHTCPYSLKGHPPITTKHQIHEID